MRRTAAALLLAAASALALAQPASIPFVDAHVHLNDPAMQLRLMEQHGATQAVVFWGGLSDNASVLEAARRHPGRFIPFASISPERTAYRPAWERDDAHLLEQLDTLLATGAYKGIGEISAAHYPSSGFAETDFSPTGPMVRGILALARKHRVPVMLHVEITRMAELSQLLDAFPDVPVIWAHGGYTPLFLARRMLQRHPNLSYELSARTWPQHPRSPEYTLLRDGSAVWPQWLALIEEQPQRFVVGTDASNRSLSMDQMKFASVQNFLRQLSPRAQALVGRENILRLVGTPGR
jgi:predicted TIM-barrel fold metal-dependent hydrolase